MQFSLKTHEETGIFYFGNSGLCTAMTSQRYVDEDAGKNFEQSGIHELILGIMKSIDDEKVVQWCTLVFKNKPFWKSLINLKK